MDVDVIVVGAGPTGLMLATELGLAGVRTTVLEQRTERDRQSKAGNLQPRSVEVLDCRGLLASLPDQPLPRQPSGHFAGLPVPLDYQAWDTHHPYQLAIAQARIEAALETRVAEYGIPVLRGHQLTGLHDDGHQVTVEIRAGDRTLRADCRWLVGCDGARSQVRRLLGVGFPGRDATMSMVAADVTFTIPPSGLPTQVGHLSQHIHTRGQHRLLAFPLADDAHRLLFGGPGLGPELRHTPVARTEIEQALAEVFEPGFQLGTVRAASRFTDAARQVEQYRTGRVLLAGDAAHIHLPTGGQGLNLGLQDAFNLGWKLAAQAHGWAPPGLLDSYHAERHPVGAAVLANTEAQRALGLDTPESPSPIRALMTGLLRIPQVNHLLTGMVSGLDVHYPAPDRPDDPLLGRRLPDLDTGTGRLAELLRPGRGLLLEYGTDRLAAAAAGWLGRVEHHTVQTPLPAQVSAVLVRPDGHVCWSGHDQTGNAAPSQGLEAALRHWFGVPQVRRPGSGSSDPGR